MSRPGGFGPLAAPTTNDSGLAGLGASLDGPASRVVADDDGQRYVAFTSQADGLSPDDDNRFTNVYVRDRLLNVTTLVSRADGPAGAAANGHSSEPSISANGVWVAFTSDATNLSDADEGGASHVYARNIVTGETRLIDRADGSAGVIANEASFQPSITVVGGNPVVAFASAATNLGSAPGNIFLQVYVRSGTTTTMMSRQDTSTTVDGNGSSSNPSISADGAVVAFQSNATNLLTVADGNGVEDVFIRGRGTPTTTALVSGTTPTGDGHSRYPSIDGDGNRIAFVSLATNIDPAEDSTPDADVYVRDMGVGMLVASRDDGLAGAKGNGPSGQPSITHAGTEVVFASLATNLEPGDTNGVADVFMRTGLFGVTPGTVRVSAPGTGAQGDAASYSPSIARNPSNNSTSIAYATLADNMGPDDDDDFQQVYVRRSGLVLSPNAPTFVSRPTGTGAFRSGVNTSALRSLRRDAEPAAAMSGDGRYTVFLSAQDDLVGDDDDRLVNVYRRDNLTGETVLVSRADGPAGAAANGSSGSFAGGAVVVGGTGGAPSISADGTRVAFSSDATNLVAGDANLASDVFVRDVAAGTTTLVSRRPDGAPIPSASGEPTISADGRRVAFVTAHAMDGDAGAFTDVYVRDLAAGTTTLVSRRGANGPSGNGHSSEPAIDANGTHVAFATSSTDLNPALSDANGVSDVWVRDLAATQTTLVSRAGAAPATANQASGSPAISGDGNLVAFQGGGTNYGAGGDLNGAVSDVFVRNVAAGTTTLVSRTTGAPSVSGNGASGRPSMSSDGTRIVFQTFAPDLLPGDLNQQGADIGLRDTVAGTTELVTTGPSGQANGDGDAPAISGDGNCVAFGTTADNLVAMPAGTDFLRVVARAVRGDCPFGPVPPPPPASQPAPPSGGAAAKDTTAPVVSAVRLAPARFRAGTRLRAAAKGRPAVGARLRLTLSEAAAVTVRIEARLTGRRLGTRCVAPRRALTKACVRLVARGSLVVKATSGPRAIVLTGRLRGRALPPGVYRGTVTARDAAGNVSAARTFAFTVLR